MARKLTLEADGWTRHSRAALAVDFVRFRVQFDGHRRRREGEAGRTGFHGCYNDA